MGYTESEEDVQIVSGLMEGIQNVVIDYQVSESLKLLLRTRVEATGPDGATASHLLSESSNDCESQKQVRVNTADGSPTGTRLDPF